MFIWMVWVHCAAANVFLSEFLARNTASMEDEDGDSSDWIEIYNDGEHPVNLFGWHLTDDDDDPTKWTFPEFVLLPGEYAVVFASGKDRRVPKEVLHTNFKLAGKGEYLGLVMMDGATRAWEFSPSYPAQTTDVSYGLVGTDNADYPAVFFVSPTPGGENDPSGFENAVQAPRLSHMSGYYTDPFELIVTADSDALEVNFTTDGSIPSETNGEVYSEPLLIESTTTFRGMAYRPGSIPSRVSTHSYLFSDQIKRQGDTVPQVYPEMWTSSSDFLPADYEMDPGIIDHPEYAHLIEESLLSLPAISLVTEVDDLFGPTWGIYMWPTKRGVKWERPVSFELIHPDGSEGFQIDAALRIHGHASREPKLSPKHSFRLLFKGPYGPAALEYPLFGPESPDEFESLILRAGYNHTWTYDNHSFDQRSRSQYLRDLFVSDSFGAMGQVSPRGFSAHLFLNGMYWGIYTVQERPDASFQASHFGGEERDWDVLSSGELVDGNLRAWYAMVDQANSGLERDGAYFAFQDLIDLENFTDYFILNIWTGNTGWGRNNWYAARKRDHSGRWRCFSWDAEVVFVDLNENLVGDRFFGDLGEIFEALRENRDYKIYFGDRVHRHFFSSQALAPENVTERWQFLADQIDLAVILESARWGDYRRDVHPRQGPFDLYTRNDHWLPERERLISDYFPQRTSIVLEQFCRYGLYPRVAAPEVSVTVSPSMQGASTISLSNPQETGEVVYTLNGGDPRMPGGAVNPDARIHSGTAVSIRQNPTLLRARVLNGTKWSALAETTFTLDKPPVLVVTELMYNPPRPSSQEEELGFSDNDQFEFIELGNSGDEPIGLAGVRLSGGIEFKFSSGTLAPAGYVVVAKNRAAFEARYGSVPRVGGEYHGNLSNGGETIVLAVGGQVIAEIRYDDRDPWPTAADGGGFSLEPVVLSGTRFLSNPANWRASLEAGGSPGTARLEGNIPSVNPNPFADDPDVGGGWRQTEWLGYVNDTFFPWVYHTRHGWFFVVPENESGNIFLHDLASATWWFTTEKVFPNVYDFTRNGWIYYIEGTSNPREFVDLGNGKFFTLP